MDSSVHGWQKCALGRRAEGKECPSALSPATGTRMVWKLFKRG